MPNYKCVKLSKLFRIYEHGGLLVVADASSSEGLERAEAAALRQLTDDGSGSDSDEYQDTSPYL